MAATCSNSNSNSYSNPDAVAIDVGGLLDGPPAEVVPDPDRGIPSVRARLLVDCRCHLGECVLWDDRQNAVLFTSILDRTFHKLSLSGNRFETFQLPKMLGAFGLLETTTNANANATTNGYIAAWEDGFQLYDLERNTPLGPMSRGEPVNRSGLPNRLNDGRVDPTGRRFVCGGMAASHDRPLKVYKCECECDSTGSETTTRGSLVHSVLYEPIRITNSLCWSLSGEDMYLADSPDKTIRKFEYDLREGTVANEQLMHTKPTGFPDGYVATNCLSLFLSLSVCVCVCVRVCACVYVCMRIHACVHE